MARQMGAQVAELFRLDETDQMVVSVAEAIRRGGLPIRVLRQETDLRAIQAGRALLGLLGRSSGAASLTRAARYVPEAVVKFVPRGGVNTPSELKAQLAYIGRLDQDREVGLHHSLGFEGDTMSRDEIGDLIRDWSENWRGMSEYGQTRHMIVSFPEDFDPARAEDAARAACDRAFSSGDYGDVWEFVSAFHAGDDETPNPHLHVVVQSRGMEHGLWMDTRMHAALSPDTLRRLVAEEARDVGLELNATARFERGYPTRGRSSADYWRAAMGRDPVGRAEDRRGLDRVKRLAITYAAIAYEGLGALMSGSDRKMADAFEGAATRAKTGKGGGGPVIAQTPEAAQTLDQIIEIGNAAVEKVDQVRAELDRIPDPAARLARERQIADLQGEVAQFLPDRPEYLAYEMAPAENIYALAPDDAAAREARRIGLDPEELALRAGETPSQGRVLDWQTLDVAAVLNGQGHGRETAPESLVDRVRDAIGRIYRDLADRATQSEVVLDRGGDGADSEETPRRGGRSRGRDDDDGYSI